MLNMKSIDDVRRENLRKAIDDLFGGSQTAAAARLGKDKPTQVNHWLGGTKNMSKGTARIIEEKFELPPFWMDSEHGSGASDASIIVSKGNQILKSLTSERSSIDEPIESNVGDRLDLRAGRPVAIVGEVQGGPDGYISIDDYPMGHGHKHLPEVRSRDSSAYGLKVRGDSMRPRIKSGEYIVVEPTSEAQPGDDVVVKFTNGSSVVKELLWIRDGDVCLGSINNGVSPITKPVSEIVHIHRVAAIMPRGSAVEFV